MVYHCSYDVGGLDLVLMIILDPITLLVEICPLLFNCANGCLYATSTLQKRCEYPTIACIHSPRTIQAQRMVNLLMAEGSWVCQPTSNLLLQGRLS